ncbi:MAG: carbohydrate kinase family protein [Deltaproteobacteria bacterium]|nr:carbohydrate kinase family protein [Deltaproteobacteria bacterium]
MGSRSLGAVHRGRADGPDARRHAVGPELVVVGLAYFELHLPRFRFPRPGEERFVASVRATAGGALNTASVARALGVDARVAHPAGDGPTGAALRMLERRIGLPAATWPVEGDPAVSLVFSGRGERTFLSAARLPTLQACPGLPRARWIHAAGLVEARLLAGPLARARVAGAGVSVAGSWAPAELRRLARRTDVPWDLLVLSRREAELACGDARRAPERLAGAATSVVVTDGARGARGMLLGRTVRGRARKTAVVDPTGAGDAFCAGLLVGLLRGLSPSRAVALGCRSAERVLGRRGGLAEDASAFADLRRFR